MHMLQYCEPVTYLLPRPLTFHTIYSGFLTVSLVGILDKSKKMLRINNEASYKSQQQNALHA